MIGKMWNTNTEELCRIKGIISRTPNKPLFFLFLKYTMPPMSLTT